MGKESSLYKSWWLVPIGAGGFAPRTVAALCKRYHLPKMSYGAEFFQLNKKMLSDLGKIHYRLLKPLPGLPYSTYTDNGAISVLTYLHYLTR